MLIDSVYSSSNTINKSNSNLNKAKIRINKDVVDYIVKSSNQLLNCKLMFSLSIEEAFNILYLVRVNIERNIKGIFKYK